MTRLLAVLVLASIAAVAHAAPPFVVIPGADGITVKLTSAPKSDLAYEIRHWPDGKMLTQGAVEVAGIRPDASGLNTFRITGLNPKLWSPQDPQLYEIELRGIGKVRFGFRTFEIKDRRFYLNGRAVFLRAMPICPPGRELPEATGKDPKFMRDYLRLIKTAHVNLIRTETQEWLDACDEIGIMTFQGRYGPVPGTTSAGVVPAYEQVQPGYRSTILDLASHPSVVIYVLSNEIQYEKSPASLDVLNKVREDLRLVDPTRPVIGNAGFGRGKPGEIFDLHPYYGYYGGNLCDWYNLAKYQVMADEAEQPFTLSECVGAYTSDAGTFLTMSKQLATMLRWAGPAVDQEAVALDYQAELVRQVVEIPRRMRTEKSGIASVMPFTYFLGWANAKTADDLIIKPAFVTLRTVFQPVLISAECWRRNLYSGSPLVMRLCVTNDSDDGRDLHPSTADVRVISSDGKVIGSGRVEFPTVRYYANAWADMDIQVPDEAPRGDYEVRMTLTESGKVVSTNQFTISIAPRNWTKTQGLSVVMFDPSGESSKSLKALGVNVRNIASLKTLPASGVLVIGEGALNDKTFPDKAAVLGFLEGGGRILCLRQNMETWRSNWLPANLVPEQKVPSRSLTYAHPVGGNATIFDGLRARDLRFWNEIGRSPEGTPNIGPVFGPLKPSSADDLKNMRVWAVCDQIMRGAAITEVFHGRGSVILSQFACIGRISDDPYAAKLLANMVKYASSPDHHALVDLSKPVRWDLEAWRRGVIASTVQGFLPHSPIYQHLGSSKGLQGADHRIDGVTLVGEYSHRTTTGWLEPVPDPNTEGWGIVYGKLTRPAARFVVKARNASKSASCIRLMLDDRQVGEPIAVNPNEETTLEWRISRKSGPVKLKLLGDQDLVLVESRFE